MKVGSWLATAPKQNLTKQAELAAMLGVSTRTLRNWRTAAKKQRYPRIGRPAHDIAAQRRALWFVAREARKQGYPGWRAIHVGLKGQVPVRLVQRCLKLLKERKRTRQLALSKRNRQSIEVLVKNAVWTQDGTHLGRIGGRGVEAQVIKDRATLNAISANVGYSAKSQDVIAGLDRLDKTRGLPLVLMTDNGSAYCDQTVQSYLKQKKIVHLRSLPRTPQHNAAAEIAIGELKRAAGLGKGSRLTSLYEVQDKIDRARSTINECRVRASRAFKTACELDEQIISSYNGSRDEFYSACCRGVTEAVLGQSTPRARRQAEREAILSALENHGLIKRGRGSQTGTGKAEIFL